MREVGEDGKPISIKMLRHESPLDLIPLCTNDPGLPPLQPRWFLGRLPRAHHGASFQREAGGEGWRTSSIGQMVLREQGRQCKATGRAWTLQGRVEQCFLVVLLSMGLRG